MMTVFHDVLAHQIEGLLDVLTCLGGIFDEADILLLRIVLCFKESNLSLFDLVAFGATEHFGGDA